jgi:hypothetical protein
MRVSAIALVLLILAACTDQHAVTQGDGMYPLDLTRTSIRCNDIEREQDRVRRRLAMAPVTKETQGHQDPGYTPPQPYVPAYNHDGSGSTLSPGARIGAAVFGTILGQVMAQIVASAQVQNDKEGRAAYERYGGRLQAAALSQECPATN